MGWHSIFRCPISKNSQAFWLVFKRKNNVFSKTKLTWAKVNLWTLCECLGASFGYASPGKENNLHLILAFFYIGVYVCQSQNHNYIETNQTRQGSYNLLSSKFWCTCLSWSFIFLFLIDCSCTSYASLRL